VHGMSDNINRRYRDHPSVLTILSVRVHYLSESGPTTAVAGVYCLLD
jgi:hypothetical protein